jgi:sugar-phosphatase
MGMRTDEVVGWWHRRRPWLSPPPAAIEGAIVERVIELIRSEGQPLPGVEHALGACRRLGLRLALASSSSTGLIDAVLAHLGLANCFALRCSAEAEALGKPDPAVFLTTARRLGVEPADCVVLEDSQAGVAAARAAGMRVVAVPPPNLRDAPGYAAADVVIPSLLHLTPSHLLGQSPARACP